MVGATPRRDRDFNDIGRKIHKAKKGRTDTPAGRVQAWKGLSFSDESYNQFLCTLSYSFNSSSKKEEKKNIIRPTRDQQDTSKKQQRDQQDQQDQQKKPIETKNKTTIENIEDSSLSFCSSKGIGNYAGLAGLAGPHSDFAPPPGGHALVGNAGLSQYISEMARKDKSVRVSDMMKMGFEELEILEALDNANWRESTRGWWQPPRRGT